MANADSAGQPNAADNIQSPLVVLVWRYKARCVFTCPARLLVGTLAPFRLCRHARNHDS
ncbi:hypothetical protein J6590_074240 [Homalodisca vitripennis]|nr:hypothetical protein J6590_074235 [Homalodisca vitripennis]KAG8261386.1 hypothetical protein J6590_074240 [Homalodisca vitripennis]